MSDNNNNNTIPETLSVTRDNGKVWNFVKAKLRNLKKAEGAPDKYALVPMQPKTPDEKKSYCEFVGPEVLVGQSIAKTRGMSIGWCENAIEKAMKAVEVGKSFGEVFVEQFTKFASEFSVSGETIKALKAEKELVMNEMKAVAANSKLNLQQKQDEFNRLIARVSEIDEAITLKSRAGKDENEEEQEVESEATA